MAVCYPSAPLDEFTIAVGHSNDNTLGLIEAISSDKIRITRTTRDERARAGGRVFSGRNG